MIKGITIEQEKIIKDVLKDYPYSFFYYGSRVKGNFEKVSDLDILAKGNAEMPLHILNEIKYKFDNSSLPYIVNISDFYNMEDYFYKLIEKDLIRVP